MAKMWSQQQGHKVVCLRALYIDTRPKAIDQLIVYVDKAQRQITEIAQSQEALPQLGLLDMIILPVRMAGVLILYITQRSIKQQGSYRIAANFRKVGRDDRDVPCAPTT